MQEAALVCLLLLAIALVLYFRYRNTPAARWKTNIHVVVALQEARLRFASRELIAITDATDDPALRNKLLLRQLEGLSVDELARYPRIGPITVSRLRTARLESVAACGRVELSSVPGIGPARAVDLTAALVQIARETLSQFDAGASPEGAAYKLALMRRRSEFEQRRQAAEAALHAAEAVLATLRERARIAHGVTFNGFLRRRHPPGLTVDVMNQPLVAEPAAAVVQPATPRPVTKQGPSVSAGPALTPARARSNRAATPAPPKPVEVTPLERMRAVIALGLAMAKADGRIAAAERKQVRAFVERRYTIVADLTGKLDAIIAEIEGDVPTLGDALGQIRRVIPVNAWPELYQFASSVAGSAGQRNTREVESLARLAEELGIRVKPAPIPEPAPAVVTPVAATALTELDCRAALEIAADTPLSVDLVRRQYRLLSDRFDPEKFATHGPEFARLAAEKRDRAERAARHLLAGYNEPLEPPTPTPPTDLRHNPDLDDVFGV